MLKGIRAVLPSFLKAWYHRAWRRWKRRPPKRGRLPSGEPSFDALVTDQRRWLFEHLPLASAELHDDVITKAGQRRMAALLGLPTAETYVTHVKLEAAIDHVRRSGLDRFVIKPNWSFSAHGLRTLVRDGDELRDVRREKRQTLERWHDELAREYGRMGRPDEWIVEELLLPVGGALAPVDDVKFSCFGGRTELIHHAWKAPGQPWRAQWFARDWTRVAGPVRVGKAPKQEPHPPPVHADLLLETAERAASRLCYPFVRIDLYDTSRGVVLGELTPSPGRRSSFTLAWDERLSRAWRAAAADLVEGLRTGRIEPPSAHDDPGLGAAGRDDSEREDAVLHAPAQLADAVPERPGEAVAAGSAAQPR